MPLPVLSFGKKYHLLVVVFVATALFADMSAPSSTTTTTSSSMTTTGMVAEAAAFVPTTGRTSRGLLSSQDQVNNKDEPALSTTLKLLPTSSSSSTTLATTTSSSSSSSSSSPLVTLGLLADIQYAPIPDGASFNGAARYYRYALDVAGQAARHFQEERVDLVVNLGDVVDGKCQELEKYGGEPMEDVKDVGEACVQHVLDALATYTHGPVVHAYGNHCLYNLDRPGLQRLLGIPMIQEPPTGEYVGYHSKLVTTPEQRNVRLVVLDSYDICFMRHDDASEKHQQAVSILQDNNPNYPYNPNSPQGLEEFGKRFVAFNGAVGPRQLEWLRDTLQYARDHREIVLVLSHQPIMPGSTKPVCLMWNYDRVLEVLREYRDVVAVSFSGHAHKGGYLRDDESGIHFRVVEAVLENPAPHATYAFIDVHTDQVTVRGMGNCESAVYSLDHLSCHQETDQEPQLTAPTAVSACGETVDASS